MVVNVDNGGERWFSGLVIFGHLRGGIIKYCAWWDGCWYVDVGCGMCCVSGSCCRVQSLWLIIKMILVLALLLATTLAHCIASRVVW